MLSRLLLSRARAGGAAAAATTAAAAPTSAARRLCCCCSGWLLLARTTPRPWVAAGFRALPQVNEAGARCRATCSACIPTNTVVAAPIGPLRQQTCLHVATARSPTPTLPACCARPKPARPQSLPFLHPPHTHNCWGLVSLQRRIRIRRSLGRVAGQLLAWALVRRGAQELGFSGRRLGQAHRRKTGTQGQGAGRACDNAGKGINAKQIESGARGGTGRAKGGRKERARRNARRGGHNGEEAQPNRGE